MTSGDPGPARPTVTAVIPTYGRPDTLPHAVASARAQADEVVVVDDGSPQPVAEEVAGLDGVTVVRDVGDKSAVDF